MLEMYIRAVDTTRGITRQQNLRALRNFLKEENEQKIIREIANITSQAWLKILWEAGLVGRLQQAVEKRNEELKQRRMRE